MTVSNKLLDSLLTDFEKSEGLIDFIPLPGASASFSFVFISCRPQLFRDDQI